MDIKKKQHPIISEEKIPFFLLAENEIRNMEILY